MEKPKLRKLNRDGVAVPASLAGPSPAIQNERDEATTYYANRKPWTEAHTSFTFSKYRSRDVKLGLRQLACGNCAYCESKIGGSGAREVEHYRPKGRVEGIADHPGYWWLASEWDNLLPTCRDCNKSLRQHIVTADMTREEVEELLAQYPKRSFGKASQFEIVGARALTPACKLEDEDPLLINPCETDPSLELCWDLSAELPIILPRQKEDGPSAYGAYTIQTCALNRAELVLDRISVRRQLRAIRTRVLEMLENWEGDETILETLTREIQGLQSFVHPDQPYIGMATAFIEAFQAEIEQWLAQEGLAPIV